MASGKGAGIGGEMGRGTWRDGAGNGGRGGGRWKRGR